MLRITPAARRPRGFGIHREADALFLSASIISADTSVGWHRGAAPLVVNSHSLCRMLGRYG